MNAPDIISISISALLSVFVVLSGLAIIMQLILRLFPEKEKEEDLAIFSAIASVHSIHFPGTKITKIKEEK